MSRRVRRRPGKEWFPKQRGLVREIDSVGRGGRGHFEELTRLIRRDRHSRASREPARELIEDGARACELPRGGSLPIGNARLLAEPIAAPNVH
eukprot:scaffold100071_cov69-Phaeocystis_antarctica.AAC.7